ncbi:unnamed protein product [Effrenium voratum]|uniref:glucan 1,3-beta-glucosidase n=1 Tax=Effrenium voratum TaxID=2562239 RepID=A0AA36J7Z6_9DINO|nr:unnamed protein product [Effrenium voratum]
MSKQRLARKPRGNGWQRVGDKAGPTPFRMLARLRPAPQPRIAARAFAAAKWQRALRALDPNADVASFSRAAQHCGKARRWDISLALLEEVQRAQKVDAILCTSVIRACRHTSAWRWAVVIFQRLAAGGYGELQPSVYHLGALAGCLELARQWQSALSLLAQARRRSLPASQELCGAVISACEKCSQWERAVALLGAMGPKADVIAFNTAIVACGKGLRWPVAVALLARLRPSSLAPSVVTYSSVMSALERSRQWELAVELFEEMRRTSCPPDQITWNSLISACESGQQWRPALGFLAAARRSSDDGAWHEGLIPGFNSAISACGKASEWSLALAVLEDMARGSLPRGVVCYNSLLQQLGGSWRLALHLLAAVDSPDQTSCRAAWESCQAAGSPLVLTGAGHSSWLLGRALAPLASDSSDAASAAVRGEVFVEAALAAGRLRGLKGELPPKVWRLVARRLECPAYEMLETLPFAPPPDAREATRARLPAARALEISSSVGPQFARGALELCGLHNREEFFKHCSAPMAFDPVKGCYLKIDASTNSYVECDMPHDPIEYPLVVSAGASLVGQTDEDLNAADRPRSMLLKELVKTGIAMKTPLFFLDQPAACFALFDGVRGGAAVEWCSKHFHTKLLPQLSASITSWRDSDLRDLFGSILAELDVQLVQQPGCCWEGVSISIALVMGDRLVVASLGGTRALIISPAGGWRALDGRHGTSSPDEQKRIKALGAEIVGEATGTGVVQAPFVRKALRAREWQVSEDATAEEEVRRVLDAAPDVFAALGLGVEDAVDGKMARSSYKKLALKVHPDKAPEELKARAKEAFEKVENAAAAVEAFCETDAEATQTLHRILQSAGGSKAAVSRALALEVLGLDEGVTLEEAGKKGRELREQIMKLGMLTDGNYGHPDQAEAVRMIEEAAEAIAEPAALTASKGGEGFTTLKPVQVARGLGLRDLKLPRKVVSSEPQIEILHLETLGQHHLVLLSSGATSLTDEEVVKRVRGFAGQPKAASLLVAADAAARSAALGAKGPQRFGSCIVGVLEVGAAYVEPAAKKARKDSSEKVRARHILLKHKDLKQKMDPQAHLKSKGRALRSQPGVREADRPLVSYSLACHCRWVAWSAAREDSGGASSGHYAKCVAQELAASRQQALSAAKAAADAEDGWQAVEAAAEIASAAATSGLAAPAETALEQMATQFGLHWWHLSHGNAGAAAAALSSALRSFRRSFWRQKPWRGANLGGWFLLEPGPASPFFETCQAQIAEITGREKDARKVPEDEHGLCVALTALGGADLRREVFRKHRESHYTAETLAKIVSCGLNAVRLPLGYWVLEEPGEGEAFDGPCVEALDAAVRLVEDSKLQLLLDLHGNPGGESGERPCGRKNSAWRWEDWRQDEAVRILGKLAERYHDKSCITGLQVCNEPAESIPVERLCDFYERAIEAIRDGGMSSARVAVVLPVFTHWRLKEITRCWQERGNWLRYDNVAFDLHYYHDFSVIWKALSHAQHVEVVSGHAMELHLLPGAVVGEWSLSRPGPFPEEEQADFARKQVLAYNHASHGWFFWNWHDYDFYRDWDLERGVFGSGKLPCPLGTQELEGFMHPVEGPRPEASLPSWLRLARWIGCI